MDKTIAPCDASCARSAASSGASSSASAIDSWRGAIQRVRNCMECPGARGSERDVGVVPAAAGRAVAPVAEDLVVAAIGAGGLILIFAPPRIGRDGPLQVRPVPA